MLFYTSLIFSEHVYIMYMYLRGIIICNFNCEPSLLILYMVKLCTVLPSYCELLITIEKCSEILYTCIKYFSQNATDCWIFWFLDSCDIVGLKCQSSPTVSPILGAGIIDISRCNFEINSLNKIRGQCMSSAFFFWIVIIAFDNLVAALFMKERRGILQIWFKTVQWLTLFFLDIHGSGTMLSKCWQFIQCHISLHEMTLALNHLLECCKSHYIKSGTFFVQYLWKAEKLCSF